MPSSPTWKPKRETTMLEWLKRILTGPKMTLEERQAAIMCIEARRGRRIFHLDGPAAEQLIKEVGFPVRECDGKRFLN